MRPANCFLHRCLSLYLPVATPSLHQQTLATLLTNITLGHFGLEFFRLGVPKSCFSETLNLIDAYQGVRLTMSLSLSGLAINDVT